MPHGAPVYFRPPGNLQFLDWVLTGSVESLRVGRARYCMICNESGGVIDDTIFYRLDDDAYLVIPNAGNRLEVVAWFQGWIDLRFPGGCVMEDRTESTALIACQGPEALGIIDRLADSPVTGIRPFSWSKAALSGTPVILARTGYTGEDGVEIVADSQDAASIWQMLMDQGALPCGLGARDVLRLEAGLPLHGHEIDPITTPIEAGLDRFVRFDKEYVGSQVLKNQHQNGVDRRLVGLTTAGRSAPRANYLISVEGLRLASSPAAAIHQPLTPASPWATFWSVMPNRGSRCSWTFGAAMYRLRWSSFPFTPGPKRTRKAQSK